MNIKFKSDKYKRVRGGYSRLLDIQCANCTKHLFFYQKDGPGILKRMYLDRIFESNLYSGLEKKSLKDIPQFICPYCSELLGIPYIYKKEQRLVLRPLVGGIIKKIVRSSK